MTTDTSLSADQIESRAHDLLAQMTEDEKIAQMTGSASLFPGLLTFMKSYETHPVPTHDNLRLGIPGLRAQIRKASANAAGDPDRLSFYAGLLQALDVVVACLCHYREQARALAARRGAGRGFGKRGGLHSAGRCLRAR